MTEEGSLINHYVGTSAFASVAAGMAHGYCDAQGIPLDGQLENLLSFGPIFFTGGMGFVSGAMENMIAENGLGSGLVGGSVIGLGGAALGGLATLIGYGFGALGGYLMK